MVGLILAAAGSLIAGYLMSQIGKLPPTHWLVLSAAGLVGCLFFWLPRLFGPKRSL